MHLLEFSVKNVTLAGQQLAAGCCGYFQHIVSITIII